MGNVKIPTREEHQRAVRKVWVSCVFAAVFILISMGGTVTMLFIRNVEIQKTVGVSTIIFQLIIAMAFVGFTVPYFLETRINLALSLDLGRRGLEIGEKTTDHLGHLQKELKTTLETFSRELKESLARLEKKGVDDIIDKL